MLGNHFGKTMVVSLGVSVFVGVLVVLVGGLVRMHLQERSCLQGCCATAPFRAMASSTASTSAKLKTSPHAQLQRKQRLLPKKLQALFSQHAERWRIAPAVLAPSVPQFTAAGSAAAIALQLTQGWPCRSLKHLQGGGDPMRGLWNQVQCMQNKAKIIIEVLCSMSHNAGKLQ